MTVLEANCEAHRLDGIAAYLRRGRRLAHVDLDVLMWVIAQFPGSLSSDPAGFAYWQAYDDACSEARLRGEEPPFPTLNNGNRYSNTSQPG